MIRTGRWMAGVGVVILAVAADIRGVVVVIRAVVVGAIRVVVEVETIRMGGAIRVGGRVGGRVGRRGSLRWMGSR